MNPIKMIAVLVLAGLGAACQSQPEKLVAAPVCTPPQGKAVEAAFVQARQALAGACQDHFEAYFQALLKVAEGDPSPDNRGRFSDFLLWSVDQGLQSRLQARQRYNRYFNVKFMALAGDFNNCGHTCPQRSRVLRAMRGELADKQQGLLKISRDREAYYRAARLYDDAGLVLEATCRACEAGRP